MRYSFDDMHIGEVESDGSTLKTRLFPKPPELSLSAWYIHAGKLIQSLNRANPSTK